MLVRLTASTALALTPAMIVTSSSPMTVSIILVAALDRRANHNVIRLQDLTGQLVREPQKLSHRTPDA
jgi:hypothetical protein